jgi:hypothetical protein
MLRRFCMQPQTHAMSTAATYAALPVVASIYKLDSGKLPSQGTPTNWQHEDEQGIAQLTILLYVSH